MIDKIRDVFTSLFFDPNSEDGQMKFFGLDKGLQFQEYWNLQVPQSLTYFPFYHFKYLYVIYNNKVLTDCTKISKTDFGMN